MNKVFIKNPWINSIFWGVTGGLFMYVSYRLPFNKTSTNEIFMLISFALSLCGLFFTIRVASGQKKFPVILFASLITWMLLPIVPHTIKAMSTNASYGLWWIIPFFQMLGIGVAVCMPLTWLAIRLRKKITRLLAVLV
jgi:hypothetical protein